AFGLAEGKSTGVGVWLLLFLIAVIVMTINGGINVVIERVAYRPLRNAPRLAPLITAVGMSFVLEGILFLIKGPNQVSYPNLLPSGSVNLGFASIGIANVLIVVIAVALMVALNQF